MNRCWGLLKQYTEKNPKPSLIKLVPTSKKYATARTALCFKRLQAKKFGNHYFIPWNESHILQGCHYSLDSRLVATKMFALQPKPCDVLAAVLAAVFLSAKRELLEKIYFRLFNLLESISHSLCFGCASWNHIPLCFNTVVPKLGSWDPSGTVRV